MLVPLVSFIGGTGSGASFTIVKFGAFSLDSVKGPQKKITGRFMQFDAPGGDPNSELNTNTGLFATKLVR